MNPIKETFTVNSEEGLSDVIQRAGMKLGWEAVSITEREIEFHSSPMMTKMITQVSWTENGNVNVSTVHKQKSVKIDIGGLRKGQNNKFKFAVHAEVENIGKSSTKGEQQQSNPAPETSKYTKLIEQEEKKRKNFVIGTVVGLVVLGMLLMIDFKENPCDCEQIMSGQAPGHESRGYTTDEQKAYYRDLTFKCEDDWGNREAARNACMSK
jgi:hypothetical protein